MARILAHQTSYAADCSSHNAAGRGPSVTCGRCAANGAFWTATGIAAHGLPLPHRPLHWQSTRRQWAAPPPARSAAWPHQSRRNIIRTNARRGISPCLPPPLYLPNVEPLRYRHRHHAPDRRGRERLKRAAPPGGGKLRRRQTHSISRHVFAPVDSFWVYATAAFCGHERFAIPLTAIPLVWHSGPHDLISAGITPAASFWIGTPRRLHFYDLPPYRGTALFRSDMVA